MEIDFYSLLTRAIRSLDPDTLDGRSALYERTKQMLVSHMRSTNPRASEASIGAAQAALEAAITRIETETTEADTTTTGIRQPLSEMYPSAVGNFGPFFAVSGEHLMRCEQCGAEIPDGADACPTCGASAFIAATSPVHDPTPATAASAVDAGAPTRVGALWTLLESTRVILRQPAILLVVVQATIVESVATLVGSSLGFSMGPSLGFYCAILLNLFVILYTCAGLWGSLIDATDGALQPLRFWIYGISYIGRSLEAFLWSIVLFLPAAGATMLIGLIGTIYIGNSFGAPNSFRAPSSSGLQIIPALFGLTLIVWFVNFLWASRRLLIEFPAIFASGGTGNVVTTILRERKLEVTALWLSLIALGCIFIAVPISLGALSAISGIVGAFQSVLGSFGGATPTIPFGIPGGFGPSPAAPPFSLFNNFLVLSFALQLAAWAVWNVFQTFSSLASLVYYRSAGGSAAWFPIGVPRAARDQKWTRPVPPAEPEPSARPVGAAETPKEMTGHIGAGRGDRTAGSAVDWAWLRPLLRGLAEAAGKATASLSGVLPDFRPLLTGKLLPHVQLLLAAPERGVSAWPSDISPQAAAAIPVAAYTLLGLAAMIGRGGAFGVCLACGILGFAFGIVALRAGAAFERMVIAKKAATDIGREASELDLSVASLAPALGAVITLSVTVLWRVSFVSLPLIGTGVLSGVSMGMMFSPTVTLFIAHRLDAWSAIFAAAAITALIVFAWMLFAYLV